MFQQHDPLPSAHPDVIFQRLGDEAVLYHPTKEVYYGLNAVGARVWELLPTCPSYGSLCSELSIEYPDAPSTVISHDVAELLDEFLSNDLVKSGATVE